MAKELWVVGQHVLGTEIGAIWEFQGIFDSKEKALSECKDQNWFIAPMELNKSLLSAQVNWPGVEYPLAVEEGAVEDAE